MRRAQAVCLREETPEPIPEPVYAACGRCRRSYSRRAWQDLAKLRTLSADEVHRHVVDWRDERVIEVRACTSCGRSMARMVSR